MSTWEIRRCRRHRLCYIVEDGQPGQQPRPDPGRRTKVADLEVAQRLCRVTFPGLLRRDFQTARRRLLSSFPNIDAVVATITPSTLVVLCRGREDVDAWVDALDDLIDGVRKRPGRLSVWRSARRPGDDTAA
jgi:hypothetical protein